MHFMPSDILSYAHCLGLGFLPNAIFPICDTAIVAIFPMCDTAIVAIFPEFDTAIVGNRIPPHPGNAIEFLTGANGAIPATFYIAAIFSNFHIQCYA